MKSKSPTVPRLLENQLDQQAERATKLAARSRRSSLEAAHLVEAARKKVAASEQGLTRMREARRRAAQLILKKR